MKLVIDIPEETFESVKRYYEQNQQCYAIWKYVANGTPLPKGHGKLKDVDKFNPCCKYRGGCLDEMCDKCSDYAVEYSDICNAPTIIEAEEERRCR